MRDFRFENFKNVYEFEEALAKRPINPHFDIKGGSSSKDSSGWTQTKTFDEADELLVKGWNKKIDEVKSVLEKFSETVVRKTRKQINYYVGFMPNVPRAIIGYPKSMITFTKQDRLEKQRVKHIVFDNTANCGTSGEQLLKSGLTVLKLAMILDKSNVRTRIDMIPFNGVCDNTFLACSVTIKDYRQSFNYLKMAYPIANPSFFRRHGFRYLETQSGDDMRKWVGTYGSHIGLDRDGAREYFDYAGFTKDNVLFITYKDCERADFDVEKLMSNLGIK